MSSRRRKETELKAAPASGLAFTGEFASALPPLLPIGPKRKARGTVGDERKSRRPRTICPICFEDVTEPSYCCDGPLQKGACVHHFHLGCIQRWYQGTNPLNKSCPVCRIPLERRRVLGTRGPGATGSALTQVQREEALAAVWNEQGIHRDILLDQLPPILRNDREFILALLIHNGLNLEHASEELRGDPEIVLAAVQQQGVALYFASEELKGEREIVMAAVSNTGDAFQYASEELRGDRDILLTAVRHLELDDFVREDNALEHASETLRNDRGVVLEAVRQNGKALRYASEELRNDRDVVIQAVRNNKWAFNYASEELLQNDPEIAQMYRESYPWRFEDPPGPFHRLTGVPLRDLAFWRSPAERDRSPPAGGGVGPGAPALAFETGAVWELDGLADALPTGPKRAADGSWQGDDRTCAICVEDMAGRRPGTTNRVVEGCGHVFHRECVDRWTEEKGICPTCRGPAPAPRIGAPPSRRRRVAAADAPAQALAPPTRDVRSPEQEEELRRFTEEINELVRQVLGARSQQPLDEAPSAPPANSEVPFSSPLPSVPRSTFGQIVRSAHPDVFGDG